jgi:hypothetical protein
MNFSQDDIDKIRIVNRFIVHRVRNISNFTDADKQYLLELYGRLTRCVGQETGDKLAAKDIGELKIKGRYGNRCILVKPKAKNDFIDELKERGFKLMGQTTPLRGRPTQRVRPAAPPARRTVRVRAPAVAPQHIIFSDSSDLSSSSSSSEVQPIVLPPVAVPAGVAREEEDILFGRDSALQREIASRRVAPVAAPVAAIPTDRIIQIVRDTVQETIREFISAPASGGRRKTRKHHRK